MEGSDFSFRALRSKRWNTAGAGANNKAGSSGGVANGVPPPPPPVCTTTSRSYRRKRRRHVPVSVSGFHHPGYCTMYPGTGSWWARDFNPSAVVAATSTSDVDTKLLRQAGLEACLEALEAFQARSLKIIRVSEEELAKVKSDLEEVMKANVTLITEVSDSKKSVEELSSRVKFLEEKERCVRAENLTAEVESLRAKVASLELAKKDAEEALVAAKDAIFEQHIAGFQKAARQVVLLAPGVDLSALDVEKDVYNGALVSEADIPPLVAEPADA